MSVPPARLLWKAIRPSPRSGDHAGSASSAAHADRESGPRERLTPHHRLGEAELEADRAHFVLEQRLQWFDQFELQIVGQTTDDKPLKPTSIPRLVWSGDVPHQKCQPCPLSGKPDIEPTKPNDRV
jgi:hypothetical protein